MRRFDGVAVELVCATASLLAVHISGITLTFAVASMGLCDETLFLNGVRRVMKNLRY